MGRHSMQNSSDPAQSVSDVQKQLIHLALNGQRVITSNSAPAKTQIGKTRKKMKKVHFSTVEVREYPMTLGDNPAVSKGPPVTIEWRPFSRKIYQVESHIKLTPCPRRKPLQMAMPLFYRDFLLKSSGFSRREMLEATKQVNIIKGRRSATVRKLQMAQMEEIGETMKNKMKNTFFRKKKKDFFQFNPTKNITRPALSA